MGIGPEAQSNAESKTHKISAAKLAVKKSSSLDVVVTSVEAWGKRLEGDGRSLKKENPGGIIPEPVKSDPKKPSSAPAKAKLPPDYSKATESKRVGAKANVSSSSEAKAGPTGTGKGTGAGETVHVAEKGKSKDKKAVVGKVMIQETSIGKEKRPSEATGNGGEKHADWKPRKSKSTGSGKSKDVGEGENTLDDKHSTSKDRGKGEREGKNKSTRGVKDAKGKRVSSGKILVAVEKEGSAAQILDVRKGTKNAAGKEAVLPKGEINAPVILTVDMSTKMNQERAEKGNKSAEQKDDQPHKASEEKAGKEKSGKEKARSGAEGKTSSFATNKEAGKPKDRQPSEGTGNAKPPSATELSKENAAAPSKTPKKVGSTNKGKGKSRSSVKKRASPAPPSSILISSTSIADVKDADVKTGCLFGLKLGEKICIEVEWDVEVQKSGRKNEQVST